MAAAAGVPTLKPFSAIPFPSRTLSPLLISYPAAATGRRASSLSFPKSPAFVSLFARASDLAAPPTVEAGEAAVFDEGFDWGEPEARLSEWEAEEEEGGSSGREQLPAEPSEDAKLFVGNLPFDVESEDLAELFDKAGTVEIAEARLFLFLFFCPQRFYLNRLVLFVFSVKCSRFVQRFI